MSSMSLFPPGACLGFFDWVDPYGAPIDTLDAQLSCLDFLLESAQMTNLDAVWSIGRQGEVDVGTTSWRSADVTIHKLSNDHGCGKQWIGLIL